MRFAGITDVPSKCSKSPWTFLVLNTREVGVAFQRYAEAPALAIGHMFASLVRTVGWWIGEARTGLRIRVAVISEAVKLWRI